MKVSDRVSSHVDHTFSFNRASLTGLPVFGAGRGGVETLSSDMVS